MIAGNTTAIEPREELQSGPLHPSVANYVDTLSDAGAEFSLLIKFRDPVLARVQQQQLVSNNGWNLAAAGALIQVQSGTIDQILTSQSCLGLDGLLTIAE